MSNLRTIKIRGDSTENWELANPILEYKEMACEFADNGTFFKIGNGINSWNDLAYVSTLTDIEITDAEVKQKYENNPDTNVFTDSEKSKLSGIATDATKNDTDVNLKNRANHTGTQSISTVSGLQSALDGKANTSSLGTAATRDVGEASGDVMEVGAFGVGASGIRPTAGRILDLGSGSNLGSLSAGNGIYHADNAPNVTLNPPFSISPVGYDPVIRMGGTEGNFRAADIYCHTNTAVPRIFYRTKNTSPEWRDWVEFHHTGNILTTTGQSDLYPMTQKAVTNVLEGKVDKVQTKEIVTANKTLTAADSGKLLIINSDGITITMPANSNFTIDIAKMDESFTTVVQCVGANKFREGTSTISVIRDVSITNSGVSGKEWLAIGAYEV